MYRTLEISNKTYKIYYTTNSLAEIEERSGKLISEMSIGFSTVRWLLWGGLLNMQSNITVKQAGDLIDAACKDGKSLEGIMNVLKSALTDMGFFRQAVTETTETTEPQENPTNAD